MRKLLLYLVVLALAGSVEATQCKTANFFLDYDLDSTSLLYGVVQGANSPFGGTIPGGQRIKTSGSSLTVTSLTAGDNAFAELSVGDSIFIRDPDTQLVSKRNIVTKTDADTVTVDSVITLTSAAFSWLKSTTSADLGWLDISGWSGRTITVQYDQGDLGRLDARIECRGSYVGSQPVQIFPSCTTGACNTYQAYTTAGIASSTSVVIPDPFGACRVGVKYATSDGTGVVVGVGNTKLDFNEYINSYTVGAGDDIDFTEDPLGVPKVCTVSLVHAAYTGATLASHIETSLNAAACAPDNTYTAVYSTTTHKFTISRATGAKAFDILWNSGTNNATAADTLLGFAADVTGATTYTGVATGETVFAATVAQATYATSTTACVAVADALNATVGITGVYTCTYGPSTSKVTLAATGITQAMFTWNTGTNTAASVGPVMGFSTAADDTGALSYLADNALATDEGVYKEKITAGFEGCQENN